MKTELTLSIGIGILCLLAGVLLYSPFYIWKKWRGKKAPPSNGLLTKKVTRREISFYGTMVVFMLIGFAQEHIAPQTAFGRFVSSWSGQLIYVVCVFIVFMILAVVLAIFGINLNGKKNEKDLQ